MNEKDTVNMCIYLLHLNQISESGFFGTKLYSTAQELQMPLTDFHVASKRSRSYLNQSRFP